VIYNLGLVQPPKAMTKRILIVDDDQDIREMVQVSLKFAGWQALTAASAQEGLRLIKLEPVDVVLVDVLMPDMDGLQFFQQLRVDPTTANIPVIFLTAMTQPSDRHRFKTLGLAGVITKPFNPITIWQQIAKLLAW
jgi:DNA-binding response OmpR family regulator